MLGERYGKGKRPQAESLSDRLALVYAELTADIGELGVPAERMAKITRPTDCGATRLASSRPLPCGSQAERICASGASDRDVLDGIRRRVSLLARRPGAPIDGSAVVPIGHW